MSELFLHSRVSEAAGILIGRPVHAVLLVGPRGSGKQSLAEMIAAGLLRIGMDELTRHPYISTITSIDGKAISIDQIRELQHFVSLRIPGSSGIARVVMIDSAQLMTTEAQNALLKILEEPPADTVLLLTASSAEAMLPTIRSRTRQIQVLPPPYEAFRQYWIDQGHEPSVVDKSLMLSGGLPGLAAALLTDSDGHPLLEATEQARFLLQGSQYERLLRVDTLSKQKQLCQDMLLILSGMSRLALIRNTSMQPQAASRWQRILRASYEAQSQLRSNTQPKLILMNLMLAL